MLSKTTIFSCMVIKFPALVLLSLMYFSLVLSKTTLFSYMVVTFPSLVLISFMYFSQVLIETQGNRSRIVSYISCINYGTKDLNGCFSVSYDMMHINKLQEILWRTNNYYLVRRENKL